MHRRSSDPRVLRSNQRAPRPPVADAREPCRSASIERRACVASGHRLRDRRHAARSQLGPQPYRPYETARRGPEALLRASAMSRRRPPQQNERSLRVLTEGGFEFAVIGGVAALLHGASQMTVVLDVGQAQGHPGRARARGNSRAGRPRMSAGSRRSRHRRVVARTQPRPHSPGARTSLKNRSWPAAPCEPSWPCRAPWGDRGPCGGWSPSTGGP